MVLLARVNLELFTSCKDFLRFHCLAFGHILEMKNDPKINPLDMMPIKNHIHMFSPNFTVPSSFPEFVQILNNEIAKCRHMR